MNFQFLIFNFQLRFKFLTTCYFLLITCLFLYSFTQVDLSLTLSHVSIVQQAEKWFQHIGYYQRPLATELYVGILIILFIFYAVWFGFAAKNKISSKQLWILIFGTAIILLVSYNAFSYDLFNYVFDAKVVTHYHLSPYQYKALDFPGEPMLSFMHSTHRTYPYGPAWLLLTIPFSFLGFDRLIPTLILFKLIAVSSYLGSCYFIAKILKFRKMGIAGLAFFALNPLVIIESLISAHNDIVMVCLALASVHFLLRKNYISGLGLLLVSIATKFATLFLLPAFIFRFVRKNEHIFFLLCFISMVLAAAIEAFASGQNKNPEIQPWYLILLVPWAGFINNKLITYLTAFLSFGLLLSYVPFLFAGQWPANIVTLKVELSIISLVFGLIIYLVSSKLLKAV